MNYKNNIKIVALSFVVSTLIVGCGSSSDTAVATDTTVSVSGVAIDPELQGARVFLDNNNNQIFDANDTISTLTDSLGNYKLDIPKDRLGETIFVSGGVDKVTKKSFTGTMSAIAESESTGRHITPLTTLVEKSKRNNPSLSLEEIKSKLATSLGVDVADLDKNTVDDAKLMQVALRLQKVAEGIASENPSSTLPDIYEKIAKELENKDLSASLDATITAELGNDSLGSARVKDLDNEVRRVSSPASVEALVLTVENIDDNISQAQNRTELEKDLYNNDAMRVESGEVQKEKGRRTLDSLGLADLDTQLKDKILNNDKFNTNNDTLSELKNKFQNNDFGLDADEVSQVNREQFFTENGLQDLDKSTKDNLQLKFEQSGFDFSQASDSDFKKKLEDNAFYGNGMDAENLQATVQGQLNKEITTIADGKKIVGSIVKGPIDGATIKLKDAEGNLISSTISNKGIFSFSEQTLTSEYYTVESIGGTYDDEATNTVVHIGDTQGLKTLLSKAKLQMTLDNKEYIAMTPETTLFSALVEDDMQKGIDLATAIVEAEALMTSAMIKDSSPLSALSGDKFLQTGNFTSAFPKDQSEAFARNRAISFSYMVHDLNLDASKVFDVIDLLIADYKDGKADGIVVNGKDINVSEEFALSRTKLFQDTTAKLRTGELSDSQKAQLGEMGFDIEMFGSSAQAADSNLSNLVAKYINATTLPTLHVLPLISDEDGNPSDAKETYTLTANTNVDVTIQTPEGSWITPMWRYNNNPLPVVIRTSKGTDMTLNLDNKLASDSTIHWHGFQIPAIMDGGPDVPVASGATKTYSFKMIQQAAPLWFHPHPDMETGKQVYMGLAGVYLLGDEISKNLEDTKQIPSGDKDTVLLVQDRRFGDEVNGVRELEYKTLAKDSDGMLGDLVLVNGSVLPKEEVSNTLHRYRLYNVSNARTYDFALSDGSEFTVIGTDGGLLKEPVKVNHIKLGAAERVEIVIDFSKYSVGENVMLVSNAFNGDMMSQMGNSSNSGISGMEDIGSSSVMGSSTTSGMNTMGSGISGNDNSMINGVLSNGTGLVIMRFDITSSEAEDITLYSSLPETAAITTRISEADATNKGNERQFLMSMGSTEQGMNSSGEMQMSFVINGTPFDMNTINEFVPAGAKEIWSIRNMSPMAHPFHAHAIQYQILTRNGIAASGTDLGWKDTFLVQPGETVRVIGDFSTAEGDYMYHCHILEHEDAGMMGYFRVGDTGNVGAQ